MNKFQTGLNLALGVLLLGLNVVLLNLNVGTRVLRTDFTEGSYYTLSPATEALLGDLEEPVKLHFYYTSKEKQHELLRPLVSPLKDLVAEFEAVGGDKIEALSVEMDGVDKATRDQIRDDYGVRSHPIPVKTTFESSLKNLYFELVVAHGSSVERYGLGQNFDQILRQVDQGDRTVLELGDVEYAIAKAIRKTSQGFDSAAGALASRDVRAKATVYLTAADTLPKGLEDTRKVVESVVGKLAKESGGRIEVAFVDPYEGRAEGAERTTEIERLYRSYGIKPYASLLGDKSFYAWMVLELGERIAPISLLPDGEELDEATVRMLIEGSLRRLIPGFLPTIAVAAPRPQQNPMMMRMGQQPPDEFSYLKQLLDSEFEVEDVDLSGDNPRIPREITSLLLIRPGELSDKALYAIDQFVMRGGRLVVCSDRFFIDMARARMESLPIGEDRNDKLRDLLAHWGVKLDAEAVLDERSERLQHIEPSANGGMRVVEDFIPFALRMRSKEDWEKHDVTAGVRGLTFFAASPVGIGTLPEGVSGAVVGKSSTFNELTSSTDRLKGSIATSAWKAEKEKEAVGLVATLKGRFPSYFSNKPIPGRDFKPLSNDAPKKEEAAPEGGLLRRSEETTLVVIGDSDFLSFDVMRSLSMLADGGIEAYAAGPVRLIQNAVSWGGKSDPLATIRQRPPFRRPLEGLDGKSAEQREALASRTALITGGITAAVLLLLGVGWMVFRRTRSHIDLDFTFPGAES